MNFGSPVQLHVLYRHTPPPPGCFLMAYLLDTTLIIIIKSIIEERFQVYNRTGHIQLPKNTTPLVMVMFNTVVVCVVYLLYFRINLFIIIIIYLKICKGSRSQALQFTLGNISVLSPLLSNLQLLPIKRDIDFLSPHSTQHYSLGKVHSPIGLFIVSVWFNVDLIM